MPLVTDIKQQKKRAERYSVYIDDIYAFALGDLELSNSGLRRGQELTEADVEAWRSQAGESKAYDAALRQVSYRRRSERELRDYLRRKEYGPETIDGIIERLAAMGVVDDRAFATAWIADRQLLRPRSRRSLEGELLVKGIDRGIIRDALAEVSDDDQDEVVYELASRKRRQSQYADPAKLTAYLARQGFGFGQIKKALARLDEAN